MIRRFLVTATARLDAAVYEVSGYYAYLFERAATHGVTTRLLMDAHGGANATTMRRLAGGLVACRAERVPGGSAHWKLLIAGDDRLAVGSGNLIKRDAPMTRGPGTREWWAFASGVEVLAAAARRDFGAAWAVATPAPLLRPRIIGTAPVVGSPRPAVAPLTLTVAPSQLRLVTGGVAVQALSADLIARSRRRIDIAVPYVHAGPGPVRDLLAALEMSRRGGARVRLLLGAVPEPGRLPPGSLPGEVRVMDPLRSTTGHMKGMVGDSSVIVGSANWSGPGLGCNREAALQIDQPDAAGYFAAAFERDWRVAMELRVARLATHGQGYAGRELHRSPLLEP